MTRSHRLYPTEGGEDGDGSQLPLGIAQQIPLEDIGEEMLLEEALDRRYIKGVSRLGSTGWDARKLGSSTYFAKVMHPLKSLNTLNKRLLTLNKQPLPL